jgi:hypothetical protein
LLFLKDGPVNISSKVQPANDHQNTTGTRIKQLWYTMIGQGDDRRRTQLVIYAVWNIWKEHYRRVFNNKSQTLAQVASIFFLKI